MTPSDHPNKRSVYITPDTEARLAALAGTTRAENIRRVLDLAECAEGLAEALEIMKADYDHASDDWDAENRRYAASILSQARAALAKYQEAKQ